MRSRIDFLRRCISALCTRSVGRRSVLTNLHILEAAVWELDEREVEEQETLEGVREVALGIIAWADMVRLLIGDYCQKTRWQNSIQCDGSKGRII